MDQLADGQTVPPSHDQSSQDGSLSTNLTTDTESHAAPNHDLANLLNPVAHVPQQPKEAEQGENTCQFCGISSPDFSSAEKMDLHYVLSCQMLTNCAACTQIIEVSSYTEHKLN